MHLVILVFPIVSDIQWWCLAVTIIRVTLMIYWLYSETLIFWCSTWPVKFILLLLTNCCYSCYSDDYGSDILRYYGFYRYIPVRLHRWPTDYTIAFWPLPTDILTHWCDTTRWLLMPFWYSHHYHFLTLFGDPLMTPVHSAVFHSFDIIYSLLWWHWALMPIIEADIHWPLFYIPWKLLLYRLLILFIVVAIAIPLRYHDYGDAFVILLLFIVHLFHSVVGLVFSVVRWFCYS